MGGGGCCDGGRGRGVAVVSVMGGWGGGSLRTV